MAKGKKNNSKGKNSPKLNTVAPMDNTATKRVADLPGRKSKTKGTSPKPKTPYHDILDKENLKWIGIGTAVLILGYLLMIGGKSSDPAVYDEKALFSFVRITLAPALICIGFGLQMYGIMKGTPKSTLVDKLEEKVLES